MIVWVLKINMFVCSNYLFHSGTSYQIPGFLNYGIVLVFHFLWLEYLWILTPIFVRFSWLFTDQSLKISPLSWRYSLIQSIILMGKNKLPNYSSPKYLLPLKRMTQKATRPIQICIQNYKNMMISMLLYEIFELNVAFCGLCNATKT